MSSKIEYCKKYEPVFGSWKIENIIGSESDGSIFELSRDNFGSKQTAAMKFITVPSSEAEYNRMLESSADEAEAKEKIKSVVKDIAVRLEVMAKLKGHSYIINYEDHQIIQREDEKGWDILIRTELLSPLTDVSAKKPLSETDVINLGIDICKALELCEKYKISHRNIKPESIYVSSSGNYKLGNFSINRQSDTCRVLAENMSSITYMSPEVYNGEDCDITADIYSLGLVLYRFLNNNAPAFLGDKAKQATFADKENAINIRLAGTALPALRGASCDKLSKIILKACSFDKKDRYQSPKDMRTDLEKVQNELLAAASAATVASDSNILTDAYGIRRTTPASDSSVTAKSEEPTLRVKSPEAEDATLRVSHSVPGAVGYTDAAKEESPKKTKHKKRSILLPVILTIPVLALVATGIFFGIRFFKSHSDNGTDTDNVSSEAVNVNKANNNAGGNNTEPAECTHTGLISEPVSEKKYSTFFDWTQTVSEKCPDCGYENTYDHSASDPGTDTAISYGSCENLFYAIDQNGKMTIKGSGKMPEYGNASYYPWYTNFFNVTSIVIDNGITSVGSYAFTDYDNINSVTISESVNTIGSMAFYGCDGLTTLDIPNSVTNIKADAFGACSDLTSINVAADNPNYESIDGVLYDEDKTVLIQYPASSPALSCSIPNTVTSISSGAFASSKNLTTVNIPNSVTLIKEKAFENCTALTSISIPASVNYIENMALIYCNNLSVITVDAANANYCSENGVLYDKNKTTLIHYPAANTAQSFAIPESVTTILPYAFMNIKNLRELTVNGKSTQITPDAFGETYSILNSFLTIKGYSGTSSESFAATGYIPFTKLDPYATPEAQQYPPVTVVVQDTSYPESQQPQSTYENILYSGSCGSNAYWKLNSDGVLTIYGSGRMTNYDDADDSPWYKYRTRTYNIVVENGITHIGARAFMHNDTFTGISIPNSVTSIGTYAFYDSDNLQSVYIPKNVSSIEKGAFFYAKGITSFSVASDNRYFSSYGGVLFDKKQKTLIQYPPAASTTHYYIPNTVTKVGYGAFGGSYNLYSIDIPSSVKTLSNRSFVWCTNLNSVYIPKSVTAIEKCVFRYCLGLTWIEVDPSNSVYQSYEGVLYTKDWSQLMAFPANHYGYTGYVIPGYVSQINENAFLGNKHLTSVTVLNPDTRFMNGDTGVFKESKSSSMGHSFILYGYYGSTAQSQANAYNISFYSLN